jgi:hypothetical protein
MVGAAYAHHIEASDVMAREGVFVGGGSQFVAGLPLSRATYECAFHDAAFECVLKINRYIHCVFQ